MRTTSHQETRWTKKSSKIESRSQHKQAEQWEDRERDGKTTLINQFFKPEETEETKGNDLKNNDAWILIAKDQTRWKEMEKYYIKRR